MTNILLTGATSLSNKGTCAIAISVIDELKRNNPDNNINVELFYPDKQRDIYPLDSIHNIKIVEPPIQRPIYGLAIFMYALLSYYIRKVFPRFNYLLPKHYMEADIIIDISAEAFIKYYDDDMIQYTKRYLIHLYPLLFGILLEKRIILFSQTLAPFGFFKPLMKYIIKKCIYVSVRDETSIQNLKEEGVDISNIYASADPAFLLKPSSREKLVQILTLEHLNLDKIKNEGFKILGVSLAKTTGRTLNEKEFNILIGTISRLLDSIIIKYNLFVVFIPHSSGKINVNSDDVLVGYDLEKNMKNKSNFFVIKGDYSPQDLKGLIGECNIFLSLRMHPVIAALSLRIPSILIAFNDKAYGLMKRFELEKYVCDIRTLSENELEIKLVELIHNGSYEHVNKLINEKITNVNNLVLADFKNLTEILILGEK